MKNNRDMFSFCLGVQAGDKVRRAFSPAAIRARIAAPLPGDLEGADLACPSNLAALATAARVRLEPTRTGFLGLANSIEGDDLGVYALKAKAALESAPLLIGSQHLIHAMCGSWNNENRYALALLRCHAADVGVGQHGSGRIHRYQELLRRYGLADAVEQLLHADCDQRISDGAFNFAAPLALMGHFPESLAGEILGANLYLRQTGMLPFFEFVGGADSSTSQYLDLRRDPTGTATDLLGFAETAVQAFIDDMGEPWHTNVRQGYRWARAHAEAMCAAMLAVLKRWVDPREAARHLISRRRPDACQYHEKTKLNRAPMRALLEVDDTLPFLDHLAASNYVHPGRPELSPLLTSLISSRGKMFRIFSHEDVAILRRWIAGLPYPHLPDHLAAYQMWLDDGEFDENGGEPNAEHSPATILHARLAYPRLLHTELTPGDEAYAQEYVVRWLARAARGVAEGRCSLPEKWGPGALRQWVIGRHEASNKASEHRENLPPREEVIADIVSLAPLTMIDGAWLAGFAHPALACSAHGSKLFETFFDELGNGLEALNHPVIYRDLLKAVHGDLPPTADPRYAGSSCFDDKDFELPVFWLGIGRYPATYGPEILGLNLAMELSGVGGGYRKTHKALAAYGYPTMFVDLHNSIDNISTGHTAWAVTSIDAYMASFPERDQADIWQRIRSGFVALGPPKERTMVDKFLDKLRAIL